MTVGYVAPPVRRDLYAEQRAREVARAEFDRRAREVARAEFDRRRFRSSFGGEFVPPPVPAAPSAAIAPPASAAPSGPAAGAAPAASDASASASAAAAPPPADGLQVPERRGLSLGAKLGIAAAGVAAVGGVAFLATRGKHTRSA